VAAVKAWCPPVAATLQHAATVSSQQFTSLLLAALPAFALMLQGVGYELLNAGGAVQETTNTCAPIPPILWRRWSSRVQLSDAPLTNNSPSVSHLSQQRLDRRGKPGWCWQVCAGKSAVASYIKSAIGYVDSVRCLVYCTGCAC
jgi:hypothetical protein